MRTYNDLFRPVYELPAVGAWLGGFVALAVLRPPFWWEIAIAVFCIAMLRSREAFNLYRFRASLSALRVEEMSVESALAISKRHLGCVGNSEPKAEDAAFWLGRGFRWTQEHAELSRRVMFRSPKEIQGPPNWLPNPILRAIQPPNYKPVLKDAIGVGWIHGLSTEEEELRLPLDTLSGHTLVAGTTRAGKTRLYELISTQIIHTNAPLIIIDPKGDKEWKKRVESECKRLGRKFLYFHPAYPSKSIRLNPLANWNTTAEPATRIGQLIDAEGTFAAFAWKTLFRIMRAQVKDGTMPTIKAAKEYVQDGIEPLLERLIQKYLVKDQGSKWDADLERFAPSAPQGKSAPIKSEKLAKMIGKYEYTSEIRNNRDEAIESLIAMVNHSKEHYSKMIQTLEPIMEMLGSDELGAMLSPDPLDMNDTRPIYNSTKIIDEKAVLYIGLDSLSNKTIGAAIGSIFLADLASVAGAIYNFREPQPIYLMVDEAAEVMNEQAIQLLNKGGGAGFKAFIATQTTADFDAVFGSNARTKQALGNLNNVICLRIKDTEMAKWIAESFGTTSARNISRSHGSSAGSNTNPTQYSSNSGESMSEVEIPFVSKDLLTRLPALQYFAFLGGSTLMKGRLPVFPKVYVE